MSYRRFLILALVVVAGATSCDKKTEAAGATNSDAPAAEADKDGSGPEKVLEAYYAALGKGDLDAAYGMVSEADRATKSLEEFKAAANNPVQLKINSLREFKVEDAKIDGEKAEVPVVIQGPDVPKIQQQLLSGHIDKAEKLPGQTELHASMMKALDDPDVPKLTSNQTVFMIKEGDSWVLDFDWDKMNQKRELPKLDRPKPTPEPMMQPMAPDEEDIPEGSSAPGDE